MLNKYFDASKVSPDFVYANIAVKNIYFALISLDYIINHPEFEIGIYHDEHTYYFFHIQSILTACGNISNIFYNHGGSGDKAATARSKRLRDTFGITRARFPLVFQKEVRNTNEHFDERYDKYDKPIGDYNIIDKNTDAFIRDCIETNTHLRTYYKDRFEYVTYNRKQERIIYNLIELRNELFTMLNHITQNPVLDSGWSTTPQNERLE